MTLSRGLEREIGSTTGGLGYGMGGYPFDPSEQTPELTWPLSVVAFDRMRRQDSQIASVMRAVKYPILRAQYAVDGTGCRPEVTQLVSEDLNLPVLGQDPTRRRRSKDRFSWYEHLRTALLCLDYGHMPFEQVYAIVDGQARLQKLAPRMPTTLAQINVDDKTGGLVSVEQYINGAGKPVAIPVERLVWYCNDREGGAWQGLSLLRSVYRDYVVKDRLLRVNAMTLERNGMGIPTAEAPAGAIQTDHELINEALANMRAGERSAATFPHGTKVALKGVEGTLPDVLASIRYHDEQIAGNMLTGFLKLGSTATGSRALGETFIDFFRLALDAVVTQLVDTANQHIVEDLVDLNFGPDEPAPVIAASQTDVQVDLSPDALVQLVGSGIITPDEELETYTRQRYRLPSRDLTVPRNQPAAVTLKKPAFSASAARGRLPFAATAGAPGTALPEPLGTIYSRRVQLETDRNAALAHALIGYAASVDLEPVADALGLVKADTTQPIGPDPRVTAAEAAAAQALNDALTGTAGTILRDVAHEGLVESYAEGHAGATQLVSVTTGQIGIDLDGFAVDFQAAVDAANALELLWEQTDTWLADQIGITTRALTDAVTEALTDGVSRDELLTDLRGVIEDSDLAEVLYDHAMATALNEGALDLYEAEGVAQVDVITAGDTRVDDICLTAEADGPYGLDKAPGLPLHVGCRCALMPADDSIRALLTAA